MEGYLVTTTQPHGTPATANVIRTLIVGNWKMNGLKASLAEALKVKERLSVGARLARCDVMICPPATLVMAMADVLQDCGISVGAQDCHGAAKGAFTGDISAEMICDSGARAVILGHSERRAAHGERDQDVATKARAAHRAGLVAIICVGETAGQRASGLALDVVRRQVLGSMPDTATAENTVIAYEPVWAIGTGLTATPHDVAEVHTSVRETLIGRSALEGAATRILYGGSVKGSNTRELMAVAHVNGALVGGASLVAADFLSIIESV
jgi:triosephosphate isomerase (TIM)